MGCVGNQGGTADRSLSLTLAYVLHGKTWLNRRMGFFVCLFPTNQIFLLKKG
jgi:hypothetical protein